MQTELIGARLEHMGAYGFICETREPEAETFTLAGGMRKTRAEFRIVWDSGRVSWLSDGIAAPMMERARGMAPVPPEEIPARLAAALQAEEEAAKKRAADKEEADRAEAEFREEARRRVPAWAKAVIIAELDQDESDSMSDYFHARAVRRVILGFSKHTRDLFPEMRQAARLFHETAHLADASDKAEHREKYSMGAGFYLKASGRYSNGWKVSKEELFNGAESLRRAEWLPETAPAPISAGAISEAGGAKITAHYHTKIGADVWIVSLYDRVSRDEFEHLRDAAKALGGWYSRAWQSSPAGFAFKDEATAHGFAAQVTVAADAGGADHAAADEKPASGGAAMAARLRALAEGMADAIADKRRDRLANTPKRQRQAQQVRIEAAHLERAQAGLFALAALHDAGTVPAELQGIRTKAAALELARSKVIYSGGYYDGGRDTGEPYSDTPAALAFWSLLKPQSAEERKAEELRRKVEALKFANIPGYFPTPAPIVARMIEAAQIPPEGCTILEPSAGSGAILDAIREAAPNCPLFVFERHLSLVQILEAKGYALHGSDFMEPPEAALPIVGRVLMNPPFENGQDIDHVRRAFGMLRDGGRLVAIMSTGPFYRSDAKARAFRDWFEELGGEREDIAPGAFKESGTGVGVVMVTIEKAGGAQ